MNPTQKGLSQEKLAELSGCHPTYIGQVERGEKNATLESLEKICLGLDLPLEKLFEKINNNSLIKNERNIPLECYELLSSKTKSEQEQIFRIILAMDKYKQN